jgi:hypothetical protein
LIAKVDAERPTRPVAVPLNVIVHDDDDTDPVNGTAYNVRSDGLGLYSHGLAGVRASFESDGDLEVDFGTRSLHFEYDTPLAGFFEGDPSISLEADPAEGLPPDGLGTPWVLQPTGCYLAVLRTDGDTEPLQNMAPGSRKCVRVSIQFDNARYRNTYQKTMNGTLGVAYEGTAWGLLTRSSDGNSWTLESGYCVVDERIQTAGTARLVEVETVRGKTKRTNHGLFDLPFMMTLTKQ